MPRRDNEHLREVTALLAAHNIGSVGEALVMVNRLTRALKDITAMGGEQASATDMVKRAWQALDRQSSTGAVTEIADLQDKLVAEIRRTEKAEALVAAHCSMLQTEVRTRFCELKRFYREHASGPYVDFDDALKSLDSVIEGDKSLAQSYLTRMSGLLDTMRQLHERTQSGEITNQEINELTTAAIWPNGK